MCPAGHDSETVPTILAKKNYLFAVKHRTSPEGHEDVKLDDPLIESFHNELALVRHQRRVGSAIGIEASFTSSQIGLVSVEANVRVVIIVLLTQHHLLGVPTIAMHIFCNSEI